MRESWDQYFIRLAEAAATRATCDRLHVGAVLVKGKAVKGTGYNGAPSGVPSCDEVGHEIVVSYEEEDGQMVKKEHCVRTVHAEQNLLLFTDSDDRDGATMYVTHEPCYICAKLIAQSGVKRVVFKHSYHKDDSQVRHLFEQKGILIEQLEEVVEE